MDKSIHSHLYHQVIARLRAKREGKGLSQYQLSQILKVQQSYVSKIETCERRLDILELMNICEALDLSFIDFVRCQCSKQVKTAIITSFDTSKMSKNEGSLSLIYVLCISYID